jgi:integrase
MEAKTVFLARVADGSGKFPFVPVQIVKGRPLAPKNSTGKFYARFTGERKDGSRGRVVQPLMGNGVEEAYAGFLTLDLAQKQIQSGQQPTVAVENVPADETSLQDAIDEYLASSKATGNEKDTLDSKKRTLDSFLKVCAQHGVHTVEAIRDIKTGRKVLLAYLTWMADSLPKTGVDGVRPENTRYTRMRRLGAFLKQQGIQIKKDKHAGPADTGLLAHHEFPKYKGRKADRFGVQTIQAMLKVATIDEADVIWFFLATGFRDSEAGHAEWADVDFREHTINVHAKPRTATRLWSWKPKDDESRECDVPLSAEFIARLEARRERMKSQKCSLIFPSGVCRPDEHLLRRVRAAAKRAGVAQPVTLHKFRRTFGCDIAAKFGIELARQCLGHSDVGTTQIYLSADADDRAEMKSAIGDVQSKYSVSAA